MTAFLSSKPSPDQPSNLLQWLSHSRLSFTLFSFSSSPFKRLLLLWRLETNLTSSFPVSSNPTATRFGPLGRRLSSFGECSTLSEGKHLIGKFCRDTSNAPATISNGASVALNDCESFVDVLPSFSFSQTILVGIVAKDFDLRAGNVSFTVPAVAPGPHFITCESQSTVIYTTS